MRSLPRNGMLAPRGARGAARPRRGVLLLVVLSMLVLFALIGITFVLVASQSRRALRGEARQDQQTDTPSRLLDSVFAQVVRDTTNPKSSLRGHSLLNDMYGVDGVTGQGTSATAIATGQFVEISAAVGNILANSYTPPGGGPPVYYLSSAQLQTPGYLNGCVLTMTSGPAANHSTRIVGWGYDGTANYIIRVLTTDAINATTVGTNSFMINGRPFNGTGFGFNSTTGKLDATATINIKSGGSITVPFVLLPNARYFPDTNNTNQVYNAANYPVSGAGGADEDHDAPTPQDMLLSYSPVDPTPMAPNQSAIVPSMHRPDVVQHLRAMPGFTTDPFARLARDRMASMRPQRVDHPRFPTINETGGPWDVDNDGDGIADSIWIDVGMPAQTAPDGRRYKPMAAIRVVDLDSRLNVNTHGSLAEVDPNYARPGNPLVAVPAPQYSWGKYASPVTNYYLGQGYGPADVTLAALFSNSTAYLNLFVGDGTREGRYGFREAITPPALPGPNNAISALGLLKFSDFPVANYPPGVAGYPNVLTSYAQHPDLWCRGFVGLDVRGTPLTPGLGTAGETLNNPYDINLSRKGRTAVTGGVDTPFTPAEFESVLRLYDVDAVTLPERLRSLLDTGRPLPLTRNLITTDSFDVPTPGMIAPPEIRNGSSASLHILDLIKLRGPLLTATQLATLLPPDLAAGLRMDLNRPFGNGRDDNNNGIVDEPLEAASAAELAWFANNQPSDPAVLASFAAPRFDHNNDGAIDVSDAQARQLYARHLYVLMMLLKPAALQINFDPNTPDSPAETARGLAQWAINVVDYRDRDSIMTPFKYVIDPFASGWTANYDITAVGAGEGVVWGCERPELLITETLAFHDRRSEDLASPDNKTTDPVGTPPDTDYDQRLRPLGSFFVEIYNPWNTQASTLNVDGSPNTVGNPSVFEAPGEFYDVKSGAPTGLQLNRRAPDLAGNTNTTGSPVWRLLVAKGNNAADYTAGTMDRKYPDDPVSPLNPANVERSAYFVDITNVTTPLAGHGTAYYSTLAVDPVLPGRYAVVGSAGFNVGGQYVTPIGRPQSWLTDPKTLADYTGSNRCVVLKPGLGSALNQVEIHNNGSTEPVPILGGSTPPNNVQPAVAAVINNRLNSTWGASLSISEPTNAAGDLDGAYATATVPPTFVEPTYASPIDDPIDHTRANSNPDWAVLKTTGTTSNFRTVYLQRLANPTADFNAQTNPYISVDSMSVDLTVFNGVEKVSTDEKQTTPAPSPGFASLQRGDVEAATVSAPKNNLWRHEIGSNTPRTPTAADQTNQIYTYFMQHTLGYLNKFKSPATPSSNAPVNAFANGNPNGAQYVGSPNDFPFPWLTWNNRPFIGYSELMLVPRSSSSRLFHDYQMPTGGSVPYYTPTTAGPVPGFDHTLNFFQVQANAADRTHFYRLFDYVGVPSRFVGTEAMLSPALTAPLVTSSGLSEGDTFSQFHPPFNKVSNYREPGKLNINTIPSDTYTGTTSTVWLSIFNGAPGPPWQEITSSRRGYGAATSPAELFFDSNWSSYFSNPFRSSSGVALSLPNPAATVPQPDRREVDVTMLRPLGTDPVAPLLGYNSTAFVDNTARNPYFRYQNLQRLSNILTTRSNVYAIWITVGYFEVARAPNKPSGTEPDPAIYPDGLQLGAELGSDSGNVKRHRAFYIYDRSIPVGFEPGKDHNVENGVLLRRFIE